MEETRRYRTWGTGRAPRLAAVCYPPGSVVHVVVGTAERRPVFLDHGLAVEVLAALSARPATLAACLMPDHLHWLVRLEDPLADTLRGFKTFTTRLAWGRGVAGSLWQRSFYDRLIRDEVQLGAVVEYIRQNPVRAGLVTQPSAYPYLLVTTP
jgi:putative transposase